MQAKIGSLDCLIRAGDDERRNVVLLHGFGADASDLYPLADYLDPDGQWTFYFPQAPHEIPYGGLGWFPISLRELEAGVDFTKIRPPGLDEAKGKLGDMIFELNCEKLVLGGFSQGAMVALDMAMGNPDDISGLLLYSGTLLDEPGWTKSVANLKGKKFLQSHGTKDSVLPFSFARRLYDMLTKAGLQGDFVGFDGGHTIPMTVLKKSAEFARQILG